MAYVPGVKNDVFISYAHVDNEKDLQGTRWVSEFVRGFGLMVRQWLGGPQNFTLFFDESDLHAHHQLQILLENTRQSAIFVAVLSPSYVAHNWTMQELKEFAGIASDMKRIIVVEKLPLDGTDRYPAEIEHHKRTQFWRTNVPESYAPSTLTAIGEAAQYKQTLETLAHQVQQLLRDMRKTAKEQGLSDDPPRVAGPKQPKAPPAETVAPDAVPPPPPVAKPKPPKKPARASPEPPLKYATVASSEIVPRNETLLDLLRLDDGARRFLDPVIVIAFAALAAALAGSFRSAIGYPFNAPMAFSTLGIAGLVFHLMAAGLGARLGTISAAAAALAAWTVAFDIVPAPTRVGFGGPFVGMIPAAFVLGTLVERGWGRTYWRTALATFLACMIFAMCVLAGAYLNEQGFGRTEGLIRTLSANFGPILGVTAAMAAGYAIITAAIYYFLRRWLVRRRA